MADVWGGGPPVNEWERRVIRLLRDEGPVDWGILHNVEIPVRGTRYEIDLIVVTGHSVVLLDVKGTTGRIEVIGHRWYPERREPFGSPVAKLNSFAGAFRDHLARLRPNLNRIFVDTMVVLPDPTAVLVDRKSGAPADADSVASLGTLIPMLADVSRVRKGRLRDLSALREDLAAALNGTLDRPTSPRRYGHWEVTERLGGSDEWTEYRARNADFDGAATAPVRLRVYRADPFLPREQRDAEKVAVANAYRVMSRMPPHECVLGCKDFFATDDEDEFVLVVDDPPGRALQLFLTDARRPLSTDAKLRIVGDVLRGLAWAHRHRVLHRALSPTAVMVKTDGRAMLTGFDYARPEEPRASTVMPRLERVLDAAYVAPECQGRPQNMSKASDVYAAGVLAFRLLTGDVPFTTTVDQHEKGSVLPSGALSRVGASQEVVALLLRMCALHPVDRPTAVAAAGELARIQNSRHPVRRPQPPAPDYRNLPDGYLLTPQYTIRRKLGAGTFGVVYQVYDNLAGTDYAIKIIDHLDSPVDRVRQEYQVLLGLGTPGHPNVVAVKHAGLLDNNTVPYLVFEYLDGPDLKKLLHDDSLTPADALSLGRELAAGLTYLHQRGVFHCDMKSNNVIRTDSGCRIVDFNVSVTADATMSKVGGNNRYRPPDVADNATMDGDRLMDRDIYGAGLIVYEALTGGWPYESLSRPVLTEKPTDPRKFAHLAELSDEFAAVTMKAIAPLRADRYGSAEEFGKALRSITSVREPKQVPARTEHVEPAPTPAGVNPFVGYLKTLYSQSSSTNAGTRGHDSRDLYVATKLDTELTRDILAGEYRLVVITGNAGDGKTAFLERLAVEAVKCGGTAGPARANGADVQLVGGAWLRTNHDGSQDEGDRANDDVLLEFFAPFADSHAASLDEIRLIAINEGRLVDFCTTYADQFAALGEVARAGLNNGPAADGIAVVNLNNRSIVAAAELDGSLLERVFATLTDEENWTECTGCELARTCYARHNALTLGHPNAGPKVVGRLRELYTLTHLRGQLHITMRDARSACAYTLTSGRDCGEIHQLYRRGDEAVLDGFYFNSCAGYPDSTDRLLTRLREIDVAKVPAPALDRKIDYVGPDAGQALMSVDGRGDGDLELLRTLFDRLPRAARPSAAVTRLHARYLAAARRRFYFECVDESRARDLLPYRAAATYTNLLTSPARVTESLPAIIEAINRGEGLSGPSGFGDDLALQVRAVTGGTIRSYRLFPKDSLRLEIAGVNDVRYLETQPDSLVLVHRAASGYEARLRITLDLFEFLHRLRDGYLPGVAEEQGVLLGLTIFKNALSAAPYQRIVLTAGDAQSREIERTPEGRLVMRNIGEQVSR